MAETERRGTHVQDTRNAVFDATVNVAMAAGIWNKATLVEIHETLLELYGKEPKKPQAVAKTPQQYADEARGR